MANGPFIYDLPQFQLQEAFERYGRIRKVWVARRPPGFAFIEFEDTRDAEDAVRGLDGSRICGVRAKVELSNQRGGGGGGGGRGGGRRFEDRGDRGYDRGGRGDRDYGRGRDRDRDDGYRNGGGRGGRHSPR